MSKLARPALTALAAFGALGALSFAAQAQPLHHAVHHIAHQAPSVYAPGAYGPPPVLDEEPARRGWIHAARDDDSANAKNPALPWYERGRGQETGGPDRMQIPE